MVLPKSWQTCSVKDQLVNILGLAGHIHSVPTTQASVAESRQGQYVTDGQGCVPVKPYL